MESQFVQIRDKQKEIWNRFSSGWKKWDDFNMKFLKPISDEIIHFLKPKGEDVVLDVASGTGEPGLSIASKLRGGIVVITDLSRGMLDIARENAARRGIKNTEFIACDATELPFSDRSFDSISCRLGFMFFPDMLLAAKEMVSVLKPGGRIAVAVWNVPEKNFWASEILNIINRNMQLIPAPPDAPGIFRCSKKGLISDLFKQVGITNISESEVHLKLRAASVEEYWNFMTEVVSPVVAALSTANSEMKARIRNEVFKSIGRQFPYGKVAIDSSALVTYGVKSAI